MFLSRGEALQIEPIAAPERLQVLAGWRAWRERPSDPRLMLELAPCRWHMRAPQRWDALEATLAALLERGRR